MENIPKIYIFVISQDLLCGPVYDQFWLVFAACF